VKGGPGDTDVLCDSRNIHDAHAADGERQPWLAVMV
jgi:hypothetical protein